MSEPIRAVLFDLDGTLIDTEPYYCRYWALAGQALGLPMTEAHARQMRSLGRPYSIQFIKRTFGEDCDYFAILNKRIELMGDILLTDPVPLRPGVRTLLDYLRTRPDLRIAVATANAPEKARRMLNHFGLSEDFSTVISAKTVAHGKPAPDVYRFACETLGLPPEQCIAIEDSPNGVISAFGAGCKTVYVPDQTDAEDCLQPLLWACVDSMDQLIPMLEAAREEG